MNENLHLEIADDKTLEMIENVNKLVDLHLEKEKLNEENNILATVKSEQEFTETKEILVSINENLIKVNENIAIIINVGFLVIVVLGAWAICSLFYKTLKSFV